LHFQFWSPGGQAKNSIAPDIERTHHQLDEPFTSYCLESKNTDATARLAALPLSVNNPKNLLKIFFFLSLELKLKVLYLGKDWENQ
jgi:hypothetical protein